MSCGCIFRGAHYLDGWVSGQQLVALSSGEAEFYALGRLVAGLLFLKWLGEELGTELRVKARSDSSAARGMAGRTGSGAVKHLETRWLWLQERVRAKQVEVERVRGVFNPADLGTKILSGDKIVELCRSIGLGERILGSRWLPHPRSRAGTRAGGSAGGKRASRIGGES